MARVVLIADAELIVAERNPACLAAPAGVNQVLAIGKQGGEGCAGVGSAIGQEFRPEDEGVRDSNRDHVSHSECQRWSTDWLTASDRDSVATPTSSTASLPWIAHQ